MADDDVLWVPVLPSLSGFAGRMSAETRPAAERAGREAGDAFAGGLERAEASVRKATDKLSAAQDKVADATGRRNVAQTKLNELEASGRASASQLAAAQEAVERAARGVVAAQRNQESAARGLADANAAAARASQEAGDAVEVQGRRFHGFGGSVSGAIGELKGFAIAAAGVGGAMATVGMAIEREQVGRKVSASFGESAEEAKRYGELAGNLYAGGLGGSLEDVQAAVQATAGVFGSLDTMGSDRLGALSNKAQTLADVFDMDVSEAAETASNLMTNGFASNADEAFDLLTRGMQEVSVSMRGELPEILQEYGTNFRALGFDGKESFNLLISAAQQGKFALDKTGDALKEYTLLGSDMSESSQEAYKAIGLNAEEMSRKVAAGGDGAQEALQATAAGLLGIEDPLTRANTAIALFGTPLEDLSVDQIPAFLQGLAGADDMMGEVAGATDRAGEVMYGGLGNKLELMGRGFQDHIVDMVGEDVLPLLGEFTGALEENEGSALGAIAGMTGLGGVVAGFETAKGTFDSVKDGVLGVRDGLLDAKDKATQAWSAVQTGAGWVKAQASAAASFVKTSASATLEATKTAAAWSGAQLKTAGGWVAAQARAVGAFVAMSASAVAQSARTAAAWVASNARVAASFIASRAAMVATTVATGAMTAAQWLLNVALNANPIGLLIAGLAALAGAVYLAWQNSETFRNIVMAAWEGIKTAAQFAWENVLQPIFGLFMAGLRAIGDGAMWLWNNAISPAMSGIGSAVSLVWQGAGVIFDLFMAGLRAIGDAGLWLWNVAIQPAMNGIGSAVSFVWSNVVSPVFDSMKTGVGLVGSAFEAAVGFIGRVWDGVKAVAAKPIKFVIDSVYNNGIRAAWNKVAGWLGLGELEEYKPEWLGAYASGGTLPGYSPGRDNMRFVSTDGSAAIDLSGGESILRPEVAKAVGPGWVDGVNQAAASGGPGAVRQYLGGYAGGGVIGSIVGLVQKYFPGMSITSTQRDTNDLHGAGLAVDFSDGYDTTPGMQEAARFFFDNYAGELLELIHYPLAGWQNIDNGNPFDFGEPTNSQHRNHVHVAADHELGDPNGGGSIFGRVWSTVTGAVSDFMRRRVAEAFDSVIAPIGAAIPDFGGSLIGSVPKKAFDMVTGKVREWLLGKADEKDKAGAGGGGNLTPGTGPVVDQVREAMAAYGWDQGAQWDAVDWIVNHESSWNPTARNASSGAFGLAQFLGSTKDQYLPDENPNPRVQGDAMARYIRDRYGDPLAAKRFWEQNGWYDQGGIASGRGLMLKNVLDPERVLDPRQTSAFEQLVPWLVGLAGGIADQPVVQGAANAALPGAGIALDALAGGFAQIPGSAEFGSFLTQLPGQIFEETAKDTASFFGLGELTDAAFQLAEPAGGSSVPAPEPPAGADTDPPAGGAGPGAGGPLVVIEKLIVDNVNEAANAIGREARRLVRSDALSGGW